METINIPRKEHLKKGKIVITKFQCNKCKSVHKWNEDKQYLETDCNCGWVYLKPIEMRDFPLSNTQNNPQQKSENVCECGHNKDLHDKYGCSYCSEPDENGECEYCPCKKFVPKSEVTIFGGGCPEYNKSEVKNE